MYRAYRTETFDKKIRKLSAEEQKRIENIEQQLKENPFVGKPLGYRFFREKKVGGKRIYYLVYDDLKVVLLVAVSDKKTQQATIDMIKENMPVYYEAIKGYLQES